ncbi:MAG: hypothetical protein NZ518_11845, partial [Dehalococcoidia bacterium]|nr:hypothetical protein [Dehalococcoidia bacterium]
ARRFALLGVVVVATFLMKQNYGVLLALGVAGAFVIDGRWWRPLRGAPTVRLRQRRQLVTAAVVLLLLAVWFAYPQKLVQTIASLRNEPFGPDANSLDGILFYPRQTLWLAGSWPLLAIWIGATIGAAATRLRDPKLWPLLILAGLQIVFAQLSVTKVDRHILPLVPPLSLLTGVMAASLWSRRTASLGAARRAMVGRLAGGGVVVGAVAHALLSPAVSAPVSDATETAIAERIVARVAMERPSLVIGDIDTWPNPPILDWLLLERNQITIDGAGSMRYASEIRFATSVLPRLPEAAAVPLRRLAERWPSAGTATVYFGVPLDGGELVLTSATATDQLDPLLRSRRYREVITLPLPESPRLPSGG